MILIPLWILFAVIVGVIGSGRSIGFFGAFLLSLFLSPLIGLIIALVSGHKVIVPVINIRCDGCRNLVNGKYIAIRPHGTKDKYDYCSEKCRDEYHPKYMQEKGIDWSPATK